MGAKLAHDLILSPRQWKGTLNVDADNPAASSATLSIDARSIEIIEASALEDAQEIGEIVFNVSEIHFIQAKQERLRT